MNRKVLVLTLALLVALAGSAMAAVDFSGEFKATAKQNSIKVFKDPFSFDTDLSLDIKATNDRTAVDWDFTGALAMQANGSFKVGKYRLRLYDDYFNAQVWGNSQTNGAKNTYFNMISAPSSAGSGIRARVEIPVADLADITLDFAQPDLMRSYIETSFEGFDIGLSYARKDWSKATVNNIIVGQVGTKLPAGDLSVDVKAAAGVTLGDDLQDDLGLGFGFSADTKINKLGLEGSVTHANEFWKGEGSLVKSEQTIIKGKGTYTESLYELTADVTHTLMHRDGLDNKNSIKLGAIYRMSTSQAFSRQFHNSHWFKGKAPAFGVDFEVSDFKFDTSKVTAKVASPIVDDMVWVRAIGDYNFANKNYSAEALGHVVATNKLLLKPFVGYKSSNKELKTKLDVDYKIGISNISLELGVEKNFILEDGKDGSGKIEASIKVPF